MTPKPIFWGTKSARKEFYQLNPRGTRLITDFIAFPITQAGEGREERKKSWEQVGGGKSMKLGAKQQRTGSEARMSWRVPRMWVKVTIHLNGDPTGR